MIVRDEDIGGAYVRRVFRMGDDFAKPGEPLTREQVLAFPQANRQALIDNKYIDVYPPAAAEGDLLIVSRGFGKYDVIQGRKLNIEPLTKEQAEAMVPGAPPEADAN